MSARAKRSCIFVAITLACVTLGGVASACPTGGNVEFSPPPRPKPRPVEGLQQASFQVEASALFERASALETAATGRDRNALAFEQQADTLANRARILRNQATLVNVSDQGSILDIADELATKAAIDRSRASGERTRASELRMEARSLRDRATQLVRLNTGGGGGGWRGGGGIKRPTAEGVSL